VPTAWLVGRKRLSLEGKEIIAVIMDLILEFTNGRDAPTARAID
jgi:hypothetical protein